MNPSFRVALFLAVAAATAHGFAAPSGEALFGDYCASCHGLDGRARTPAGRKLGAKDLSASKLGDAEIEKQILGGTKDARGNDRMPSFREKLKPEEIAAVAAYVKHFRR